MVLFLAAALIAVPPRPASAGFFALYGTNGYWTNRVFLGYPRVSSNQFYAQPFNTNCTITGTNCVAEGPVLYFATNYTFPSNNTVWLTVTNRQGYGSDVSCASYCPGVVTNLAWTWRLPPAVPVTNIVTVSSGWNSVSFTNPAEAFTWYRLRGLSWTNAALQANWNNPPSWSGVTVWSYPSNRTPSLTVIVSH